MPKLGVSLLTGRTIEQGRGKELGKLSEDYWESVTVCEMDPDDMVHVGVAENETVEVTTHFGSTVLKVVKSLRAPHPKVVFVPYGPPANVLVDPETHGTGMPSLKGIRADIEPAPGEKVLSLQELLKTHFRKP
jgi:formylmethanofuran dehydrogenase subunit D